MLTNISNPKSICILRLSAIGDVCHAVATVQAIQRRWPEAKISWVIGKIEAQLVTGLKDIEFIIFDKKSGFKAYQDLRQQLSGRQFDILLHMQIALRASLATLCIRATEKWGFDRSRAKEGQWFFTNRRIAAQMQPHVADGFWAFAQAIGVEEGDTPLWNMPLADTDINWCKKQLKQDKPYIVISPSASKSQRNWFTSGYADIADHASSRGFQVIISGAPTPSEIQLAKEICQACECSVIDLTGKTSLPQLLALLSGAELVIAPDSGPAHMATIVNTPVIGLYAHSNPKRTGPYHSAASTLSVYEQLLLRQTGKSVSENRWGKRVRGEKLMHLITLNSVIEAFNSVIDR